MTPGSLICISGWKVVPSPQTGALGRCRGCRLNRTGLTAWAGGSARGGGRDAMSLVKNILGCISLNYASGCVQVRVTSVGLEL